MHEPQGPYQIPTCREWVPEPLRAWLYLAFVLCIQFSGAVTMALTSQRAAAQGMLREDVLMAGFSMLVGMTMIFPDLFPLKFSRTGKSTLFLCALGLVACNVVSMYARSMAILVPTCFFAGSIRMLATFECFSTIQLKITPTRDFGKFLPVVYSVVLGMVQFSGLVAVHLADRFRWEAMNVLSIGLLLCVALATRVFLKHIRLAPPFPFGKADWLGHAMWSLFLLQGLFVLTYGEHFEWFDADCIRSAVAGMLAMLLAILARQRYVERPYIDLRAFGHRNVLTILVLFAALSFLLSTPDVLQRAFTGGVLHYGALEESWLNAPVLVGILCGALFCFVAIPRFQIGYRIATILGITLVLGYLVGMVRIMSPDTTREMMIVPLFLRGMGSAMVFTVLTIYAARTIPFHHFFQMLAIMGFVHTDLGEPLGCAIVERLLALRLRTGIQTLGSSIDGLDPLPASQPLGAAVGQFQRDVLLVSIRNGYGIMILFGILVVCLAAAARYRKVARFKMPRW